MLQVMHVRNIPKIKIILAYVIAIRWSNIVIDF